MKKIISTALIIISLFNIMSVPSLASNGIEYSAAEPTLGQIEEQVFLYLEETNPDVLVNTVTYMAFLVEQLMDETDEKLVAFYNYSDISLYMSEYIYQFQCITIEEAENKLYTLPDDIADLTPNEKRLIVAEKDAIFDAVYRRSQSQIKLFAASFSPSNAVKYARDWVGLRNLMYNAYASDCTNFVSQCLVAGGLSMFKPSPMPEGLFSTNYYWYSTRGQIWWNESSSFINVADFAFYLTANVGATVTTTSSLSTVQSTAKPGDIVQLKNSGGEWYHTIIITGGTSGNRTYCAHSTDRLDYAVSNISASQYRILHIN